MNVLFMAPPASIVEAFDKLNRSVSSHDAVSFQSTTLEDVWKAARDIERSQRERQSIRNMRRIEPFLNAIEKYSKVIEVLCNGTPYLPFIWAPIKLMLLLASEYAHIFDKLVKAYASIAEAMPRFDRFKKAFHNNADFQNVLGLMYADILEFHQRAYKFFRRRAWHILFDSLWKDFTARFNGILERLARHTDLVDKEALSIEIVEARSWRLQAQESLEKHEKERHVSQLQDSITWLAVEDRLQEDDLDRLSRRRQPGTCDWVLTIPKMTSWMDDNFDDPTLWLKGKPGAGKSILCSHIIQSMKQQQNHTVAYYFCDSYADGKDRCSQILRSLALQLLRANLDLAPHVSDSYANRGFNPSMQHLRNLLPELLATIPSTRFVLDGLDEVLEQDQKLILRELFSLLTTSGARFKLLISSRELAAIGRALRKKTCISLRDRKVDVDTDIRLFVKESLIQLRERFEDTIVDNVEQKLVEKADGMFLWVRLVIKTLEDCHSIYDLESSVDELPEGLDKAYGKILDRITNSYSRNSRGKAIRILEWMACSYRTLKIYEVQDGIVFHTKNLVLNDTTRLTRDILELCKPLIEEGPGSTVDFVHFSAKEYIFHPKSGPFLLEGKGHHNVAFSCVSYLLTSLPFVDPPLISQDGLRYQVVKGMHGLMHYASQYWIEHLLQSSNFRKTLEPSISSVFNEQLYRLVQFQKRSRSPEFNAELERVDPQSSTMPRLLGLGHIPEIQNLVYDVLVMRQILAQENNTQKAPDSIAEYTLQLDPTFFSEVRQGYQTILESLLGTSSLPPSSRISQMTLDTFKELYGSSAFLCRFSHCSNASEGFASRKEREKHETLHTKRFKCADSTCEFYIRGFPSKSALQNHNRKYHATSSDKIPEFLQPRLPPAVLHPAPRPRQFQIVPLNTLTVKHESSKESFLIMPEHVDLMEHLTSESRYGYKHRILELWKKINWTTSLSATSVRYNAQQAKMEQLAKQQAKWALRELTQYIRREFREFQLAHPTADSVSNELIRLDLNNLPGHQKREEQEWCAKFNPSVLRVLDIDEIHTFGHDSVVSSVVFSPGGEYVATGCHHFAYVFDVENGSKIHEIQHSDLADICVRDICFSPDGRYLATVGDDKTIRVWHMERGTNIVDVGKSHEHHVFAIEWSASGDIIASGSANCVFLWRWRNANSVLTLRNDDPITSISLSPNSVYVAAGSLDKAVHLWDCRNGTKVQIFAGFNGHENPVYDIAFTPDSRHIISASLDWTIKMWSIPDNSLSGNGEYIRTYNGHIKYVRNVKVTSDGRWIISGSDDRGVHFWNLETGDAEARLEGHDYPGIERLIRNNSEKIACSPSGGIFATVSTDKRARIWRYKHYHPIPDTDYCAPDVEDVDDAATRTNINTTNAEEAIGEPYSAATQLQRPESPLNKGVFVEPMNLQQVFSKIHRRLIMENNSPLVARYLALHQADNYMKERDNRLSPESVTLVQHDEREFGSRYLTQENTDDDGYDGYDPTKEYELAVQQETPDYQTQLMMLEQQNKKRLLMAKEAAWTGKKPSRNPSRQSLQDYNTQLSLLKQQNKNRLLLAKQEQEAALRQAEGAPQTQFVNSGLQDF